MLQWGKKGGSVGEKEGRSKRGRGGTYSVRKRRALVLS
jgi:hypothetical protein